MVEHQLIKVETVWHCSICSWQWKNKPKTECPGVTRYEWNTRPEQLQSLRELKSANRQPLSAAEPAGCIWRYAAKDWVCLYDLKDTEITDPNLLPIYRDSNAVPQDFKTKKQLRQENLKLKAEANPCAALWSYLTLLGDWGWIFYYHPDDCEWEALPEYICKLTLRSRYLLSGGWIKRLGAPDLKVENPHNQRYAAMQLYLRQRVENFLAMNAVKYSNWLDKRDRYLEIFEANRDKIESGRAAASELTRLRRQPEFRSRYTELEPARIDKDQLKQQTLQCLQCASGLATSQGFLCAIYPGSLPPVPCPDWQQR